MQSQIQEQRQEQRLQQTISQQQLLQAQLIELPIQQLIERIDTEMHDNAALEPATSDLNDYPELPDYSENSESPENTESSDNPDDYEQQREREERQDELDLALESFGRDDEDLPVYSGGRSSVDESEERVYGNTESFYDHLIEQVAMLNLTDRQRYIMEYLIRSLEDDGLMRATLEGIVDELAIYHNLDTTEKEVEGILKLLQKLDPPGIGARSLQECLLLQIDRRKESRQKELMRQVITDHFEAFTRKHWEKIGQALNIGEAETEELIQELRRLNPKPGASMGETIGRSMQQITPDFIVETQDDGTVTFTLNNSEVPQLQIAETFADLMKNYQNNKENMSRQMKEALLYTKQKVDAAQSFIDAIRTRQRTLYITMKAIIQWQHRFFEEGDEALLRPMILKDIAERTGLDVSTVSRVSNSKYAQTRWGMFPLKFFFSDGFVTDSGEELSTREIKATLRDIIDAEDKHKPLSDDTLSDMLKAKGYPVARRTVAKYRQQMDIPIARLRK